MARVLPGVANGADNKMKGEQRHAEAPKEVTKQREAQIAETKAQTESTQPKAETPTPMDTTQAPEHNQTKKDPIPKQHTQHQVVTTAANKWQQ